MANITLVTASGSTVTPKDDGLIYEVFSPGNGLIYGGVVSIKDSSTLHITAGHGIVCGRKFTIDDADIPVVLSGSGTLNGRLYIHLDLADVAEPIALLVETGSTLSPEVRDSDVNINNGVYDINIATFTVSTTTIADLVNIDNHIAPIDFGTEDISGVGDGSIKGAISELNADIAKIGQVTEGVVASGTNSAIVGSVNLTPGVYVVVGYSGVSSTNVTPKFAIMDGSNKICGISRATGREWSCSAIVSLSANGSVKFTYAGAESVTTTTAGVIRAVRIA